METYITRYTKERLAFMAMDFDEEMRTWADSNIAATVDLRPFSVPSGTEEVSLDNARFRCTEILFNPGLNGKV